VSCPHCGRAVRLGAHYCAACGADLLSQPPAAQIEPPMSAEGTGGAMQTGSQSYTRPSVSLVELSRRKTRAYRTLIPISQQANQSRVKQSKAWQLTGYALLILVLLAGAVGLYLIWIQLP